MLFLIIYIFIVFLELVFAFFFMIFTLSLLYSSLKGSPYVPTRNKEVQIILEGTPLKKDSYFIELGSGDGKIVRTAVKDYHVRGLGIDVNPLLTLYSRFLARVKKVKNVDFRTQNIFDPNLVKDLKKADTIYLFLMPKILEKLALTLENNCRKNTMIISHGFKIECWEKKLSKKIDRKPFPTYYYKL